MYIFLNVLTKKYYVFFGELLIINQSMLSPIDIYELITSFSLINKKKIILNFIFNYNLSV